MSGPTPCLSNRAHVIADMEGNVHDVKSWAHVLMLMGTSPSMVPAEALSVIGEVLHDIGEALGEQWERAVALSHPEAEQPRGKPCA